MSSFAMYETAKTTGQPHVKWLYCSRMLHQSRNTRTETLGMLYTPLPGVHVFSTINPSTHLRIKIVLDHMSRFARLFVKDLAPFICSVWRSIYLGDQLSIWMETPLGFRLTMQRDGIFLRVRIQDLVKPMLHYISWLRPSACSYFD